MCARLLKEEWAHGDLKPDNIIITPSGHGRLIDYDAAYVPDSGFDSTPEIGTPAYQHPLRDTGMYDKHIDDYPSALLSANLHLIALAPHLMPDNDETPPLCATKNLFPATRPCSTPPCASSPRRPTPETIVSASCSPPPLRT
ncbi:MAG: hypothetical protein L6V35_04035 [Alistipes putredinis]|nr:MAG: hypothetical protein L6V35_04035 [Alistipes putredinis]